MEYLPASANQFKNMLDSLSTAVVVLERNLTIRYLNPAAENLFETSLTRSAGLAFSDILLDSDEAFRTLRKAAASNQSYTRRETEFLMASGSLRMVDYSVSPRSEEHTSELQSRPHLVCRLLLEKKKKKKNN